MSFQNGDNMPHLSNVPAGYPRGMRLSKNAIVLLAWIAIGCDRAGDPAKNTPSATASASAPSTASVPGTAATTPKSVDSVMVDRSSAHGIVKSIDPEKKKLSIAHDTIPGFMKAMTMPFEVKDAATLDGIAVGDSVDFSFVDDGSGHLVVDRIGKK
ncbi:hypothetical protein BH09MYX1_BH09MYX1_30360 [soil metagenome]